MRLFVFIGMSLLWANVESHATLLNLSPPDGSPDLMGSFESVSYSTNNNLFQAIGSATAYSDGSATLMDAGDYVLSCFINNAGVLANGGLSISGDIGFGNEVLLTGDLTALGFNDSGGDIFEFLFTVTGGNPDVVSDFGGLSANGG